MNQHIKSTYHTVTPLQGVEGCPKYRLLVYCWISKQLNTGCLSVSALKVWRYWNDEQSSNVLSCSMFDSGAMMESLWWTEPSEQQADFSFTNNNIIIKRVYYHLYVLQLCKHVWFLIWSWETTTNAKSHLHTTFKDTSYLSFLNISEHDCTE